MNADRRKDFLWVFVVSLLILIWGSIPTWAGYHAETQELRFRGIYYDSQDYAVHIATREAGRHGEWAYQFRFTTEPHNADYIRLFHIVLGHFSQWLGMAPEFMYSFARWTLDLVALFTLYRLMRLAFPDLLWARIAFLLAALGSGVGWLQVIFNWTSSRITPIDFWLIDDYVFFSLSVFPHFAFVTAGMCIALSLWIDFLKKGHRVNIVLNNDPLWGQFTIQNQTLSPPPDYYLWGFALFWPLAFLGINIALCTKSHVLGAAVFWVVSGFLLAYAPLSIQRRFYKISRFLWRYWQRQD